MENATAYLQFAEWLKKQPYWLQDAALRIYNKKKIDDQQISAYIQMCIDEANKKTVDAKILESQILLP